MAYQENQNRGRYKEFPQTSSREMHALMECMSICSSCCKKCIEEGHKKTAELCGECADICALTIKSQSCQSDMQQQITDLCVQCCQRCASECQKVQAQHCQECADICNQCATACSNVHSYQ
jgi:hypothetical protein